MRMDEGCLLRIFVGERDKHEGMPLYEWIVERARDANIAGATVLRGMAGYGTHHRIHTAKVLRLSVDLPIVVEIIDTVENIKRFMPVLESAQHEGLATLERVEFHSFKKSSAHTPEQDG
jgi:PII-like signaling protein